MYIANKMTALTALCQLSPAATWLPGHIKSGFINKNFTPSVPNSYRPLSYPGCEFIRWMEILPLEDSQKEASQLITIMNQLESSLIQGIKLPNVCTENKNHILEVDRALDDTYRTMLTSFMHIMAEHLEMDDATLQEIDKGATLSRTQLIKHYQVILSAVKERYIDMITHTIERVSTTDPITSKATNHIVVSMDGDQWSNIRFFSTMGEMTNISLRTLEALKDIKNEKIDDIFAECSKQDVDIRDYKDELHQEIKPYFKDAHYEVSDDFVEALIFFRGKSHDDLLSDISTALSGPEDEQAVSLLQAFGKCDNIYTIRDYRIDDRLDELESQLFQIDLALESAGHISTAPPSSHFLSNLAGYINYNLLSQSLSPEYTLELVPYNKKSYETPSKYIRIEAVNAEYTQFVIKGFDQDGKLSSQKQMSANDLPDDIKDLLNKGAFEAGTLSDMQLHSLCEKACSILNMNCTDPLNQETALSGV